MGTLGKVLLFVNLLAAAGLTYLAAQDWARRQEVTALALRHHLALKGLPVEGAATADTDELPVRIELTGGVATDTVRKSLLANHFQGAEGGGEFGDPNPPVSQLAELDRVKAKLDAVLGGKGGPAERLAYLCGVLGTDRAGRPTFTPGLLARLATSYAERSAVVELLRGAANDPQAALARAESLLEGKFAAAKKVDAAQADADARQVKEQSDIARKAAADAKAAFDAWQQNPQNDMARQAAAAAIDGLRDAQAKQAAGLAALGGTASRDATDQRRRIARLLSELDPSAGWQKRTALVVGLRTYREALAEQVDQLRGLTQSARAQAVANQAAFADEYALLKNLAGDRTLLLAQQQRVTADAVAQQAREREATAQRRAQFLRRQADLAEVRKDVAELLANQQAAEAELFGVLQRTADALRQGGELEEQLRQAEYGKQPR
jgi:hypothetical protein